MVTTTDSEATMPIIGLRCVNLLLGGNNQHTEAGIRIKVRDKLNAIIGNWERYRGVQVPRIGPGHSNFPGGIFSLLQDPGGKVHTPGSGATLSRFVDIDNDDPTAKWSSSVLCRVGIPKGAVTPWNALGAYDEQLRISCIVENLPLCQE